jgi:regulatory protein
MVARRGVEPTAYRDGIVTALVPRRGSADRIGVHLDGRFVFDLSATVLDRAGLRAGDILTADRQRELHELDAPYRARERALRFLAARDRSRREVELRLRQAGFASDVVEETVVWLARLDYANDRRFAAAYAAEKNRTGWGPRRIRVELAGKGVERAVIDEVLEQARVLQEETSAGHGDETGDSAGAQDTLEQTVRKRFGAQFGVDPETAERRLAGFLGRRGYDWDTIARMVRMLRAEASAQAAGEPPFPSIP